MNEKEVYRFKSLDGLRGILALSVMMSHFIGSIYGWSDDRFLIGAYLSVVYFFIMSGFVLSYSHQNKQETFLKYAAIRLARLLPLHLLSTFGIILIYKYNSMSGGYVPNQDVFSMSTIIKNIFFLNGIYWKDFYVINAPSWSISIEFWASLLIPLLFNRISFLVKLIAIFLGICYLAFSLNHGFQQSLFLASFSMLIGSFCFDLSRSQFIKDFLNDKSSEIFILISFIIILIGVSIENHSKRDILYMIAFLPLLFIDLCNKSFFIKRLLSSNIFNFLGVISFPLYLLHDLIIVSNIYSTNYKPISILLGCLISIFVSYIYARYIDMNLYKYLKSKINKLAIFLK